MPTQEELQEYLGSVTTSLKEKGGKGLNAIELRLGAKFQETQDAALSAHNSMVALEANIQEAQKRLQEMAKEHLELVSKAAGFGESILALKFGDEFDKEKAEPKSNGPKYPSTPEKKKRTKKSQTAARRSQ